MSAPQRDRIKYQAEAHVIRRSIVLHAPLLRVWNALATAEGLASWLMRNDFQPIVGTRFTFRAEPQGDWERHRRVRSDAHRRAISARLYLV